METLPPIYICDAVKNERGNVKYFGGNVKYFGENGN